MNHPNLMSILEYRDVEFCTGEGPRLFTAHRAKSYLDFFTDVGTASLGYGGREISAVLDRAKGAPIHAPNLYGHSERKRAARRLCEMVVGMDKVFFCNSGAESVEAAIKLARKWQYDRGTKRQDIWSMVGSFHGRTMGALAAGDGPSYHYEGFAPLPAGFHHFACWGGSETIAAIPSDAAAVIVAPIFGNNDVRVPPPGWLEELRQHTSQKGILLIFDEVQTGSGRTGAMTYGQKVGVKPDIITLAKGIAMGCPVGVTMATDSVAAAFTPGSHFSTFGGNPLSCAFVNGMLDWLSVDFNLKQVEVAGKHLTCALEAMKWPKNVRGEGMLIAFDVDIDGLEFSRRCLEKGLLIGAFRGGPGPVKITPPLNVSRGDLDEGLEIMDLAYNEARQHG